MTLIHELHASIICFYFSNYLIMIISKTHRVIKLLPTTLIYNISHKITQS